MRFLVGAVGLAVALWAPYAAAQTDVDPLIGHTTTLTASVTTSDDTAVAGRVHTRNLSGMADFYPTGTSGFHLSAGLQFFERRSMLRQNVKTMRDLVYLPRSVGNPGAHWGYRRVASMAVGYTAPLDDNVSLGFEAGAMMGRAINRGGRRIGSRGGGEADGRRNAGPNSIVHLVLDVNF